MFSRIVKELREHAPFTAIGALSGIVFMVLFKNASGAALQDLFYVFHPAHVLLSALVTASMFRLYACPTEKRKCNLLLLLFVGYIGSVGIATLSDSLMPYAGEILLDLPHRHAHVGFVEKPWLISIIAIVGIIIAYYNPSTRFPHAGHVLISTWASLFHMMLALGQYTNFIVYAAIFVFLFLAVWLPCCISDIVFPLLFVKDKSKYHPSH